MNDLVRKLCTGDHPVEVSVRPERTFEGFKAALARQYVHIKFTDTRGGTELGVRLDQGLSDLASGDLENQSGQIKLGGRLTLDYEKVCCVANIDLATLRGRGHLELVTD